MVAAKAEAARGVGAHVAAADGAVAPMAADDDDDELGELPTGFTWWEGGTTD